MTPLDREELRRLEAAATPGPWSDVGQVLNAGAHRIGDTQDVCCFGHSGQECSDEEMERLAMADAELIVALRNAAPELLADSPDSPPLTAERLAAALCADAQPRVPLYPDLFVCDEHRAQADRVMGALSAALREGQGG